jgi:hypothetical protein
VNPQYLIIVGAAAAGALLAGVWLRGRRKSPQQRESERRERLNQVGRITDGTVVDVSELNENGRGAMQLLIYNYDVRGVSYEASQDITHLRQFVDLHSCRIGVPTSVKYDPQNPGNSIIVSERWSGLRG